MSQLSTESAPALEQTVRRLADAGDDDAAVTAAIDGYGGEVYGFLASRLRDDDAASDAFARTCEDLYKTFPAFQWRCSLRTWMYKLARSAAAKQWRARQAGHIGLSQVSEVAEKVRSRTVDYLRTEVKDRFTALREELDDDDQTLLILRVDRGLDWNDVARVLSDDELDGDELKRASARLRQRFKTVKQKLRERALEEGLIPSDG